MLTEAFVYINFNVSINILRFLEKSSLFTLAVTIRSLTVPRVTTRLRYHVFVVDSSSASKTATTWWRGHSRGLESDNWISIYMVIISLSKFNLIHALQKHRKIQVKMAKILVGCVK